MIRDWLARGCGRNWRFFRYEGFRRADVRHFHAEISKAIQRPGYAPPHSVADALDETMDGYVA